MARTARGHNARVAPEPFALLAAQPATPVDELALALAAEFGGVDDVSVRARLDELAGEVALQRAPAGEPGAGTAALREVLGVRHGFRGDREDYDDPRNSMLQLVLERRLGLPISLSVLYVAVARRADITLSGVGLPGHFIVGDLGAVPPVLLDPFTGGTVLSAQPPAGARAWSAHEIALRMLNDLVGSYGRRGDLGRTIQAAQLRLALPLEPSAAEPLRAELRALRARLN